MRKWIFWSILFAAQRLLAAETPLNESNSWAFKLPYDPFISESLIDLRKLNEKQSGQTGFVALSADKNSFVRGDGQPIRFWAVGTDGYNMSPEDMDTHCRWLAKLGVNLARLHVTVCNRREGGKIDDINQELIDRCFRFIKAAKDNGIYVMISPFYAHFDVPASWGLKGGKQDAEGLIFFNQRLQEAYKGWTRYFYTTKNPYTGLSIAEDPTVAMLQIHNEDSLLFWTSQNIAAPQKEKLARHFSAWLTQKYGSVEKAFTTWGKAQASKFDQREADVAGLHEVYMLTREWGGGLDKRLQDQAQFLAEFQHAFYTEMGAYLRDELGCKQLLNATNWRTANDDKLKALERYSYHALDFDAENEYIGSDYQHKGANSGYRIDPGDYLVNESVLPKPFEMCTNWSQEEGHPFIATETAWKNPNRYQSEGPFLVAAYQSLNGVDGICWFSCQTPRYEEDPLKPFWRTGNQLSTHKWNHCYPAMMAGFPANALLYRKGYLQEGKVVVREARPLEDLWQRKKPRITDNETYGDQRNHPELAAGWSGENGAINRAAFQVGAVRTKLGADAGETVVEDLAPFFDPTKGEIKSTTGELLWNYKHEFCTMDAPKAQGVTGFLKRHGGQFSLSDVKIKSENEYATINLVSLDDQPIKTSRRVLVQVVTLNRLTGFETKDATFSVGKGDRAYSVDGEQIVRIGKPPFRVANTEVTIAMRNSNLGAATILDINGYPLKTLPLKNGVITFPKDMVYALLHAGH